MRSTGLLKPAITGESALQEIHTQDTYNFPSLKPLTCEHVAGVSVKDD